MMYFYMSMPRSIDTITQNNVQPDMDDECTLYTIDSASLLASSKTLGLLIIIIQLLKLIIKFPYHWL